ncbi:hypothetical protein ACSBR1_023060 [Camellia fascicularis]
MTMTPYDFAMITGLGVGGDPIPPDLDMREWQAAWLELLGAHPSISRAGMVEHRGSVFAERLGGASSSSVL